MLRCWRTYVFSVELHSRSNMLLLWGVLRAAAAPQTSGLGSHFPPETQEHWTCRYHPGQRLETKNNRQTKSVRITASVCPPLGRRNQTFVLTSFHLSRIPMNRPFSADDNFFIRRPRWRA